MEARLLSAALAAAALLSLGAGYRTQNFIINAPSQQFAREIGDAAEGYRLQLAQQWLGKELPAWRDPCPIRVQVGAHLGAGGATSFMFEKNRPYGWSMSIQGSRERLLDSVLPHEITHTVFATHFGQPLPRWADEGACTTVEHDFEKNKQKKMLITYLTTGRGIAFNRMFAMKEYPHDIMPLYAQGYSLSRFLIAQGGKQKFMRYVGDGLQTNNWTAATNKHYDFKSLSELQITWVDWVRRGSPPIQDNTLLIAQQSSSTDSVSSPTGRKPSGRKLVPVTPLASKSREALADSTSTTGWRARGRARQPQTDVLVASRNKTRSSGMASEQGKAHTAGSKSAGVLQSVTRPQPLGRPKQMILQQWSRSEDYPAQGSQAPGVVYPAARSAATPSYYAVPRRPTGTILR